MNRVFDFSEQAFINFIILYKVILALGICG